MNTKKFYLTAFAVAALFTASFSNVFSSDKEASLKCFDDKAYNCPDDTTGQGEDNNGGGQIMPIGR